MKSYKTKVIVFGDYFETYHYEKAQVTDVPRPPRKKKEVNENAPKKKFAGSINRTRNTVRRLIAANFEHSNCAFLTLTFAENMQDISEANRLFKAFIRALRNEIYYHHHKTFPLENFKYLAVIEFQKRGAIHYHLLINMPFVPFDDLAHYWPHGWTKINRVEHVRNIGLYVSKYLYKDVRDPRLAGKRAYQTSRNLVRPFAITESDFVRGFLSNVGKKHSLVYKNTFDNEYTGKVHYRLLRKGGERNM